MAPLAIGLALAMIHFASMGATGTSVNPARSIGPGLFAGGDAILQLWLFILAPLLGATAAGLLYPVLFGGDDPVPGSGLRFAPRTRPGAVPGYGAPDQYQQQWNQPDGSTPYSQQPHQGHYPQGQPPPPSQPSGYPQQQYPPYQQDQPGLYQHPEQQCYPQQQYPPYQQTQQWPAQDQQQWEQQQPPQQEWGRPGPDDEDGRTQVRPNDDPQ